ncbi:MAG: hypothetical protein MUF00_16420 [Gemmatimonadaceae bacterium]|nr:hypothetical protein [Gemmatimonadaceae bacterium]
MLALGAIMPKAAEGQQPRRSGGTLGQNYPNPFNPETRIPFSVGDAPECTDAGRSYRVSVQVFNVLAQPIATPVLQGGAAGVAGGQPLENVSLPCGAFIAYWDGKDRNGREVASGVYLSVLEIDGRRSVRKMFVAK